MSAYLCSKTHIDLLVSAALDRRGFSPPRWIASGQPEIQRTVDENAMPEERERISPDALGTLLWKENHRSVNYRYEGRHGSDEPLGEYKFKRLLPCDRVDLVGVGGWPVIVIKAIHCFEYQSCEHPEWEASEAFRFCQALEGHMIRKVKGYEDAPWGVDSWPPRGEKPQLGGVRR